eukprot:scaffold6780_cov88-Isochrysis_galbana.AAC.1
MSDSTQGPLPDRAEAEDPCTAWYCSGAPSLFTMTKRGRMAMMDVFGTASCAWSWVVTPSTPSDLPSQASP